MSARSLSVCYSKSISFSSASSDPAPPAPKLELKAPFDRDNLRWTPVEIAFQDEKCLIEASFDKAENSGESEIQAVAYDVALEGSLFVSRVGNNLPIVCSLQMIVFIPYGYEGRETPADFSDFAHQVAEMLERIQPGTKHRIGEGIKEIASPNKDTLALRVVIEPRPDPTTDDVEMAFAVDKSGIRYRTGVLIHAYATRNALYILSHRKMTPDSDTTQAEVFLSSFKINPIKK